MNFFTTIIQKIAGNKADKDIKEIEPFVGKINGFFSKYQSISNDELRAITQDLKGRIKTSTQQETDRIAELRTQLENIAQDAPERGAIFSEIEALEKTEVEKIEKALLEILPEAFAVVKETARRFKENSEIKVTASEMDRNLSINKDYVEIQGESAIWKNNWDAAGNRVFWDMVHYDVQLIGGVVLHQGKIAEMATGEGKTLVATLPVFLNALSGKGVHVVTVNDYLAKRDSEWMSPIFQFHGLTIDCIDKYQPHSPERRQAYLADVTYGTNNEFGFDYLRDNMSRSPEELVQRKHHFAIVDEVDSVLIDDARTPLIISGPTPKGDNQEFQALKPKVEKLFNTQKKLTALELSDAKRLLADENNKESQKKGAEKLFRAYRGLPKNKALIKFLSEPGMKSALQKAENFYMQDQSKEMHIIDDELYFVIDEKNNTVELTDKGINLISEDSSDPNFFIIPDIATEIADIEKGGLSQEEMLKKKDELIRDFSIKSERIHSVNQLLKAYTLFEKDVDYVVMDSKVKIVDEQTGRIMEGRRYSDGLHQAIEAKENVKIEAATQTYATVTLQNYFRMYHKLAGMTGTAETEAKELWDIYKLDVVVIPTNKPIARDDQQDLVYKTKREKYNALIDKIDEYVKQGRPVLVGTTSVEVSELVSRMLKLKGVRHQVLNAKLHQKEAQVVAEAGKPGTVTIATNMAGRGTDIKLGAGVKESGGLAIIGTERHESRRVDRQLRGRAGRQGDPGSSVFFVSLEDDLMRLFGSERLSKMLDRFGMEEGEVITHSMITKSIERAQKKIEENNFGIRKRLLEYDDVMNYQRESIYSRRRNALYGDKLSVDITNMIFSLCNNIVEEFQEQRDFQGFELDLLRVFSIQSPFDEKVFMQENAETLTKELNKVVTQVYLDRMNNIRKKALPIINRVYNEAAHQYKDIALPITDGLKGMQFVANLEKCYKTEGRELTLSIEKGVSLAMIDNHWKEHLRDLDDLKQSAQNAVFEQKDPLLVYKLESSKMFKDLEHKINIDIISFLIKADLPIQSGDQVRQAPVVKPDSVKLKTGREEQAQPRPDGAAPKPKPEPIKVEPKIGRNDPCPCGSGKKYKACHGNVAVS
jgi:preprotein translocase subunit SecA